MPLVAALVWMVYGKKRLVMNPDLLVELCRITALWLTGFAAPHRLAYEHPSRCHDDADDADRSAEIPKGPATGKKRNGCDYQSNFEESLAEVKAIGFSLFVPDFLLQALGFAAKLLAPILIRLALAKKAVVHLLRCSGILRWSDLDELSEDLVSMATRVHRLIFGPRVGGSNLSHDFFSVRAMTEKRDYRDENREHAHAETHRQQRTVMLRMFGMLVQLLHVILADAVVVHGLSDCTRAKGDSFRNHAKTWRDTALAPAAHKARHTRHLVLDAGFAYCLHVHLVGSSREVIAR